MVNEKFTWVKTYQQLTNYLKEKEDSQLELVELLKSVGIGPFNDKSGSEEHNIELEEIDPFTFFCYINKYGSSRRLKYLQEIAKKINIDTPYDEKGIPTAQAQKVWLFPYKFERTNNEVARLWSFFRKALNDELSDNDFEDVLKIRSIGKTKLTEALFYIMPEKYLPLNGPSKPYLKEKLNVDSKFNTYSEYVEILESIKTKIDIPFYELSHNAWKWNKERAKVHNYFLLGAYWANHSPKDQTPRFVKESIWINGYDDKFTKQVNAISVGSKVAIKSSYTRARTQSVMSIKAIGVVKKNMNDGRNLEVDWEDGFTPFELPVGGYMETFNELKNKTHIQAVFYNRGNTFEKVKSKLEPLIFNTYIDYLRKIITRFSLQYTDERLVFSLRNDRLNFMVGQRYCFNLFVSNSKGKYGVISKEKLTEQSEVYEGNPPQPFYSYYNEFTPNSNEWDLVTGAINEELGKTYKSGFRRHNDIDFENYVFEINDMKTENAIETNYPLNTIFYGPPGTGKTYNTINKALEICGEDLTGLNRSEINNLFEKWVDKGHIVFTTFHQSMTYEDFVEGIKPIEPQKEGDPVIYKVEEGVFRKLCIEASFSIAKESESIITENVLDFSIAFDNFVQEIEEKLATEVEIKLTTKNGGKIIVDGISQQGNIIIKHPGKENTYPVSKQRLSKLHAAFPDLSEVSNIDQQFRSIIGGSNSTANWSVLNAIRTQVPISKGDNLQSEYNWDDKKEVVQSLKKENYKGKSGEPYVLIIDEINRGNVSQILGELITLIEKDKRLGNEEAIQVQLPYSKEWFGVPPNLYIIGTMNTADRSVEALDTALRRRFSFVEMLPKPEIIKTKGNVKNGLVKGIDLIQLLSTVNKRIEKILDKDHAIGHSYFLSVQNLDGLKAAFQHKIIPLLQEYFFGDYGKIGLVISEEFFDIDGSQTEEDFFAPFPDYDSSPFLERKVYRLKNVLEMTDDKFILALNTLLGNNR